MLGPGLLLPWSPLGAETRDRKAAKEGQKKGATALKPRGQKQRQFSDAIKASKRSF